MRTAFAVAIAFVISFVLLSVAQAPDFSNRWPKAQTITALQAPYTFAKKISVASANWTCPDSLIVTELRVKTAGSICVSTPYADSQIVSATDFDIFKLQITKIYKTGTDSLTRPDFTVIAIRR